MANTAQSKKRVRQAQKRRDHNVALRSRMRTAIKQVIKTIDAGSTEQAQQAYQKAVPVIDSTARKGLIHLNKAARHKSRLAKRIRALAS